MLRLRASRLLILSLVYSFVVTFVLMVVVTGSSCHSPPAPLAQLQQGTNLVSVLEQKSTELENVRKGARMSQNAIMKSSAKHNAKKDALVQELLKDNENLKDQVRSLTIEMGKLRREIKRGRGDNKTTKNQNVNTKVNSFVVCINN